MGFKEGPGSGQGLLFIAGAMVRPRCLSARSQVTGASVCLSRTGASEEAWEKRVVFVRASMHQQHASSGAFI